METISKNINTRQGHFVTVMDQDRKKTMYSYLNTNKDTTTVLPQNDQYPLIWLMRAYCLFANIVLGSLVLPP